MRLRKEYYRHKKERNSKSNEMERYKKKCREKHRDIRDGTIHKHRTKNTSIGRYSHKKREYKREGIKKVKEYLGSKDSNSKSGSISKSRSRSAMSQTISSSDSREGKSARKKSHEKPAKYRR